MATCPAFFIAPFSLSGRISRPRPVDQRHTKAKRAGASGFLMKPFNRHILKEKLAEAGLLENVGAAA